VSSFSKIADRAIRLLHPATEREQNGLAFTMPVSPLNSDTYLVSFPKSGVTWLSFLLANVNLLLSGDQQRRATFFNINDLIPDIHVSRHIGRAATQAPGFRILKSHSPYHPGYTKVLLLVRHPLHVMSSYYAYSTGLQQFSGSIEEMIEHPNLGIDAWVRHTAGWLDNARPEISFRLIRYEHLRSQPHDHLREVYQLWGFSLQEDTISAAVERSSLRAMAADEERYNAGHPALSGFEFVRRRDDREPRLQLSESVRTRIFNAAQPIVARLGYQ
jgi:Sulfotransferase domain